MFSAANELWDNSGEDFKKENLDLLIAIQALQINVEGSDVVESQLMQNKDLYKGNADTAVLLAVAHHRALQFDKALAMLKLAKELEPEQENIE